ncbi:MAG: hypothetical protein A3B10_02815 [Candidatus Doudnabacteria bacterium RIFCSPLOWO2_01_FULL_44_21]|uniref:Uncharacterized protein n=1 Tax=Candidatus Doudnabacteria bacterium RIFCSPLOWO2_01_FULL_44_21 TaxID=1817841 RepID=A0A1F5Q209_9BACT|nr:MAG: hypothetical protein A3B95_03085 [Candidatus Doudnabacteria bacterium RIFCSPHIGHO2_02_FULL_43_13b]OGE96219.1 MAG: hypothetical protein A3B10_02815 [Candidatus Doudnabacteria bacterium RIFCSPLOWO2_01_FULL_44_21]
MKKLSTSKLVPILSIVLTLAFVLTPVALAQFQTPSPGGTGLPGDDRVSTFVLRIINIALAIAGLIAVLFLIIGGFRYITSAGNEETAEQAKKIITNAIIGIVVIILAFVIVRVISNALVSGQV